MKRADERRISTLRRQLSGLVMRDGEVQESKAWANVGKALCAILIIGWTDRVLETEWTLLTLLAFLIAPELVKKFLTLRLGNGDKRAHAR